MPGQIAIRKFFYKVQAGIGSNYDFNEREWHEQVDPEEIVLYFVFITERPEAVINGAMAQIKSN